MGTIDFPILCANWRSLEYSHGHYAAVPSMRSALNTARARHAMTGPRRPNDISTTFSLASASARTPLHFASAGFFFCSVYQRRGSDFTWVINPLVVARPARRYFVAEWFVPGNGFMYHDGAIAITKFNICLLFYRMFSSDVQDDVFNAFF